MKEILFWILLFTGLAVSSQGIRGTVCLAKDTSAVQFATVGLLQISDSAMIDGTITLTDGGYSISNVKPGQYLIRVSFVGYKPEVKQVFLEPGVNEEFVDTIYLTETTSDLGEVEVVAERLKGKELVDRTVYSVPEAIAKTSNTGYDILKKIPQVNVDFQNNITLNGSTNFIIQVDGRQRSREFLAKLLPTDIESIEIISNPSGKYEGNIDGVINIILKKEARYGLSGNASLSTKPFNKPTNALSGSLDYAFGKITFYATGFSVTQKLNIGSSNESRFFTTDSLTMTSGNGGINVSLSSLNTGFDYYINDRNNLSLNMNLQPIRQDIDQASETRLYRNSSSLNRISSVFDNSLHSNENSMSLFYQKKFEKPVQEFTSETNFYRFRSDDENDFTNIQYFRNSDSIVSIYPRIENNLNKRGYFSEKLNYVHPIGMNTKIETGYQLYYQQLSYDFNINNQQSGNLFEYAETRHSLYGGVTLNLKKLGFQTMLRIENSHIKADSVSKPRYTCVLPSVNLQYKFSASHNLKFTYNRRINRPGIYDMNPYYKIGQNYDITQGNPDLRPDYRDRLQLTYTWNFGSNYFSPFVYREYYSDRVGRKTDVVLSPVTKALTTLTKPFNLINGYETGGGVNAMLWFFNISARLYKGHFDEYRNGSVLIPALDYYSSSITSYAFRQLDKKKTLTAFAYVSYNGVTMNSQSKTYRLPLYGLGAQKQLKNHNFGLFWLLPFSTDIKLNRVVTETPAYTSENITEFDAANFIQFTYSYKFSRGKNIKKTGRKANIESDSKSQTIGR
jgi:outer membrane receptor protein involved in Fe transport